MMNFFCFMDTSKLRRLIGLLLFSMLILGLCRVVASAETVNRVVAIVNDEVITLHELNKRIKELTGRRSEDLREQDENRFLEARKTILENMIDEKITQKKILELGIKVSQKEIDESIERIKKDNQWTQEDLLSTLEKEGINYETYRNNLREYLERIQLINFEVKSKIIIREEQIRQYYEDHKEGLGMDAEVHLASIFLMRQNPQTQKEIDDLYKKGEDIISRLKQGEDFGKLAMEFSQGPGATEGGDLGKFKTSQLDPELKKIVQELPEGGFSNLIVQPNGIQIIKIMSKEGGGKIKSFEEARNALLSILYQQEVNDRYLSWIKELRDKSYTKIIF
ncbi:MAG: SurA N-terminal domain-containing protein [Pseudomonadota bacterium]